jgi:3-dehydroquinate dehydratase/shikimate dehydrogenase
MKKQKCDIIKIACKANTLEDNLKIFDIIKKAKAEKVDVIGICMGEKGEISRILGPYYGSVISYGYLDKGKESAPGQISCEFLKLVYRVDKINPSWKIYGLVGSPVSKSRGYIIHNLAFKEKNINAVYVNFLVDDLEKFFASFKGTFSGLSITMPHKEEVMKYLDEVNADAKKTGAINTIVDKNGKLIGYNTDEYGAVSAIEEKTTLKGKNVVMAGAGGVAHAIGHGIVKKEGNLTIVNRTREKGEKLAKELNAEFMDPNDIKWESVDIFINATSVGMMPDTENTSLEPKYLKRMKKAVVFDTIYNPLVTKLIHSAEKNNLMAISGIRMFIHQAEKQFELWTGKQAGETMENAVLEYIS